MFYIGIDPGVSGGIAIISGTGRYVIQAVKMPATDRDLLDWLEEAIGVEGNYSDPRAVAVLEKVHSQPKQGHVGAFTFGRSYGAVRMALVALRVPFDEVSPARWMGALGCMSGGDKNVSKRRAQQLFPRERITHAIADALLIAEYCRRIRGPYGKDEEEARRVNTEAPNAGNAAQADRIPIGSGAIRRRSTREGARSAVAGPPRDGAGPQRPA